MPTEDTQNNASQASTPETTTTTTTAAPDTGKDNAPLNDAQLKSGMLDAINTELDTPKPAAKTKERAVVDDKNKPIVDEKPKTEKKEAVKKVEDDPYVMPEGLHKESQKRFQRLVDVAKEATEKLQTIEKSAKQHEETITNFRAILDETKTSAEDLNGLLEYNRLVKTGNLEGALKLLDEQRSIIARYLGRPVEGVDFLAGFDDLKQAVQDGKITPEHAAELAKSRNVSTVFRQENERAQKDGEIQAQNKKQVDTAIESITKFAASKSETDIDYKRKEEILLKAVDRISANFPPHLWLQQVEMLYETLDNVPSAAPAASPSPLRPNAGGGGKPQAKSMADAIDQGLGYGAP